MMKGNNHGLVKEMHFTGMNSIATKPHTRGGRPYLKREDGHTTTP